MTDLEKHRPSRTSGLGCPHSSMPVTGTFVRHDIIATYRQVKSLKGTARQLGLTLKVVKHWVKRWQLTGTVDPQPRTGRPRALDPPAAAQALDWLRQDGNGREEVARKLHNEGYT